MRLGRIDLLRYGHFTDLSFELPVSEVDFHIVFGPNEAGKSTALSAIGDLLFGVPPRSPYGFLHNYSSMRIRALLENGDQSLEVVRRKGSKNTLLDTDNSPFPVGEATLRRFLAGADRSFFERLFSLDHTRLEEGGREILKAEDEVGQMLFSAGAGIAGLRDRLTELSSEADGLWAARRAGHREYYQATDKLKDAERELRHQAVSPTKWWELKRTLDAASENYANVKDKFENALAESKRLARIRRVYPYVRRKAELDELIRDLGIVVTLPKNARHLLEESERKETEALTQIGTLLGLFAEAREELKALTYDEQLILRADDVNHLHERRIEVRSEKVDLLKRQAELNAAEAELRSLATDLGWVEEKVDELIARIPARAKVKVVQSVLNQRGARASDLENKTVILEDKEEERNRLKECLKGLDETTDVSRLEAIIKTVKERGDIGGRVRNMAQQAKDAQESVNELLSYLHLRVGTEKGVAEMQVPPRRLVQDHRDQFRDWEQRERENDREFARMGGNLERARKDLHKAASDTHYITIEKLQEARSDRDVLWSLVKRKHIENRPIADDEAPGYSDALDDLASAFEPAMRAADELADRRFDNAEAAGRLAEMSRNISEQQDDLEQLRTQQEALTQEGERLDANWKALWDRVPLQPLGPDAMLEWLKTRDDLLEAIDYRATATSELEILRQEEREAKESLLAELSSLGTNRAKLEDDALRVTLERADSVRSKFEQEAEAKKRLDTDLRAAADETERQRHQLASAKRAWSEWQEEWSVALTELGLETGLRPEVVSAQIEVIEQMQKKAEQIRGLRHQRIDRINIDVADFERVVATMVSELADDLAATAADKAVLEIENRLEKAHRLRALHDSKKKYTANIDRKVNNWEKKLQEVRDRANHLRGLARAETNDELRSAIEKSDSHRILQDELSTVLQRLTEGGDGLALTELEAECDAIDIDRIVAKEETITTELKALRDRLSAVAEIRLQARDAFEAVGGDDAAAQAEATRQEALAEISDVSERYVRVQASAMLLQWAIDRYRREKQAPLLKRAGELFAMITRGSFKDLQVDYDKNDRAYMTGLRPDGKVVSLSGMSSGTADQLYLALRVAFIEDYLDRADALPFVADDLFINFDNDRAGAGFDALGELARTTQVLFFTHHLHLLDIAQETLGDAISVVNLSQI